MLFSITIIIFLMPFCSRIKCDLQYLSYHMCHVTSTTSLYAAGTYVIRIIIFTLLFKISILMLHQTCLFSWICLIFTYIVTTSFLSTLYEHSFKSSAHIPLFQWRLPHSYFSLLWPPSHSVKHVITLTTCYIYVSCASCLLIYVLHSSVSSVFHENVICFIYLSRNIFWKPTMC